MSNTRRNVLALSALCLVFLGTTAYSAPAADAVTSQINYIQNLNQQRQARWRAGETSVSRLPPSEQMRRVGLGFAPIQVPPLPNIPRGPLPPVVDWSAATENYVTGVRDQGHCGSCWAFAMTAALESYTLLNRHTPGVDLDLSEQVFVSCGNTGSCDGGTLTATFLQNVGLPLEGAYPYTQTNGTCASAQPGWEQGAFRIAAWGSIQHNVEAMKAALAKYGPIPTAMIVYEDFMHYQAGIYSYTSGKKMGGHGILLIGYNDPEHYFIAKNSWGPGWGEKGFFRIDYSEVTNLINFGMMTIAYKGMARH